ncbi:hypothetical protein AAEX28_06785 [Lentisphaerota bacterium WC36G]|nr:hypothetical protein LJT99_09650 [Lentisphaerae bacterium WC36]UDQ97762.1 hypothetical protein LJT99_15095 [Lentisphaerae bacterium WC36]
MKFRLFLSMFIFCGLILEMKSAIVKQQTSSKDFNIQQDKNWQCQIETLKLTKAELMIFDKNMQMVNKVSDNVYRKKHDLTWNGKDSKNVQLPTQLYTYSIKTTDMNGVIFVKDKTYTTGGFDSLTYWAKWDKNKKNISFTSVKDALVKVTFIPENSKNSFDIVTWIPVKKGNVNIAWDGIDKKTQKNYLNATNFQLKVSAMSLPENYILLMSSSPMPESFIDAKWIKNALVYNKNINPDDVEVASSVFKSSNLQKLNIDIQSSNEVNDQGEFIPNNNKIELEIDLNKIDNKKLKSSSGKIIYFLNGTNILEENISVNKVKYNHILDTTKLSKGVHSYTVNLLLENGEVGSASIKICK